MTAINCAAGAVYTKGFPLKDKLQLYGIAAVFLALLYNSPAALVLYWTCNNIGSLLKNIIQKMKNPQRVVYITTAVIAFALIVFFLVIQKGGYLKWMLSILFVLLLGIVPFVPRLVQHIFGKNDSLKLRSYILSCSTLFLLWGIVIPSQVIVSSVGEFSFIDSFTTPFPFIERSGVQMFGLFMLWGLVLYALFSDIVRRLLAFLMLFFAAFSLANTFLIQEDWGFLTNTFIFSEVKPLIQRKPLFIASIALPLLVCAPVFLAWKYKKIRLLHGTQSIIVLSLCALSVVNCVQIAQGYTLYAAKKNADEDITEKVYSFSQNGNNVLLIMLDAVSAGYIPYIVDEKPELLDIFKDFLFYPNIVSYANHTLVGALPLYGGYEYTPRAVNERKDVPLVEKQTEAYLLLPTIFADNGYAVTVTDPPFDNYQKHNLSIFKDDTRIQARNVIGKQNYIWQQRHPGIEAMRIADMLSLRLIRFAFFKSSLLITRDFLYDKGKWHIVSDHAGYFTPQEINGYIFLDMLPDLTTVKDNGNTYTAIYSLLSHEYAFFQQPHYTLESRITDRGSGALHDNVKYHVIMASFIKLHAYFQFMKDNGVYDNTRIILVSDHGSKAQGSLPYPQFEDNANLHAFNPLLMIKDFGIADTNGTRELHSSFEFMTNADVPLLAVNGLIDHPRNPWTGRPLEADKTDGVDLITIGALGSSDHSKYLYTIRPYQWLYVHDTIFEPDNWSKNRK